MSDTIREYTLSVNDFSQPKILSNQDSTCVKIMELILLEKGVYQTRPDMGVGIVSRYRYASPDSASYLKSDIQTQMETYLPELIATDIEVTMLNKNINIAIVVDSVVYKLVFSSDTATLASL